MSDEPAIKRYAMPLILGAISATCYGTVAFAPLFLVPVQICGAKKGFRAMLESMLVAALLIAAWQVLLLGRAGALGAGAIAMGVSTPAAMLAALALIAARRFEAVPFALRALAGGAIASAACVPAFAVAAADPNVRAMFEAAMGQAVSAFGGEAVDPGAVWTMVTTSVSSSFGAVIFAFLFASSWVGSRFGAARGARTEPAASVDGVVDSVLEPGDRVARAPTLATYRLPGYLVWALLGAWACLLLNRFVQSPVLSAAALNAALALSICYGVQGLAVAGALAERVGLAPALRFIGPIVLIALIASGAAGFIAVGLLALLGTLETWIPFRAATKGDRP